MEGEERPLVRERRRARQARDEDARQGVDGARGLHGRAAGGLGREVARVLEAHRALARAGAGGPEAVARQERGSGRAGQEDVLRRKAVDRQAESPCAAERARDLAEQAHRLGGIERPLGEAIGERRPAGPRADDVQTAVVHPGGEDRQERRADLRPAGRQARDGAPQARVRARGRADQLDR